MAKSKPDVILVRGVGDIIYEEYPLEPLATCLDNQGAITPGMLVETTASGTVQPHSTATGLAAPVKFADVGLNFDADSKTMGGIDDDYDTDGQAVKIIVPTRGTIINALLAAGQDTGAVGVLLASNGDGTLQVSATNPVARAIEDIDNAPGVNSLPVRILVEVL